MINNILETKFELDRIGPFWGHIQYVENRLETDDNRFENHIHDECEIYINLEGNVSFIVEDHLYPIMPGNIIFTRPYEAHHCIYHDNSIHRHYVIRFSSEQYTELLPPLFNRKAGTNNLIVLSKEKEQSFYSLCQRLLSSQDCSLSYYIYFFRILDLLINGTVQNDIELQVTASTIKTLKYINENIAEHISISQLAEQCLTSVSALERNFKKDIGTTPSKYILERRLSLALTYLQGNYSILEVCEKCGFSDYSYFIACFKKRFHTTPYRYMKNKKEELKQKENEAPPLPQNTVPCSNGKI